MSYAVPLNNTFKRKKKIKCHALNRNEADDIRQGWDHLKATLKLAYMRRG